MVNVYRCILTSPTFKFGKNSKLGKKRTKKQKKPKPTILITCGKEGEATRIPRMNSLQKANENNTMTFSSIFTFIFFHLQEKKISNGI